MSIENHTLADCLYYAVWFKNTYCTRDYAEKRFLSAFLGFSASHFAFGFTVENTGYFYRVKNITDQFSRAAFHSRREIAPFLHVPPTPTTSLSPSCHPSPIRVSYPEWKLTALFSRPHPANHPKPIRFDSFFSTKRILPVSAPAPSPFHRFSPLLSYADSSSPFAFWLIALPRIVSICFFPRPINLRVSPSPR